MSAAAQNICVVGACFIDLISYVSQFPGPGETIHGKSFSRGFGGKGANQAVAAARLRGGTPLNSANVTMIGAVGADPDGDSYLAALTQAGVECAEIQPANRWAASSKLADAVSQIVSLP